MSRAVLQENRAFGSAPVEDIRFFLCENDHRDLEDFGCCRNFECRALSSSRYSPNTPHFSGVACGQSPSHFASNSCGFFRINVTTLTLIMVCAAFVAHCSKPWEMAWKRQLPPPGFWTSRKPLGIGTPCTATFFVGDVLVTLLVNARWLLKRLMSCFTLLAVALAERHACLGHFPHDAFLPQAPGLLLASRKSSAPSLDLDEVSAFNRGFHHPICRIFLVETFQHLRCQHARFLKELHELQLLPR